MNDEKLMQQALEALENAEDQLPKPYSTEARVAITVLRERLAQKGEPNAEPCVCGNSIASNTEHRTDGPCYQKEPSERAHGIGEKQ